MSAIAVYQVQAFSEQPTGGNGAGVVLQTFAEPDLLDDTQMQAIAAYMGYSETAFVFPSSKADFKVRFFTGVGEVDLCGHATIATFKTMLELGRIEPGQYHQETLAGVLKLDLPDINTVFMTQAVPKFLDQLDRAEIARSLNLSVDELHPDLPVQIVSTGLPDVLVPVCSLEILKRMTPDFDAVRAMSERFDTVGYHVFSLETLDATSTAHCRNLAPRFGIPEEAATGTANGALSAFLYQYGCIDSTQMGSLSFEQGYVLNSPSTIQARLSLEATQILRVEVGGTACLTGQVELSFNSGQLQQGSVKQIVTS